MILLWLIVTCYFASCAFSIWPQPREFSHGDEVFWLSDSVKYSYRSTARDGETESTGYFSSFSADEISNLLRSQRPMKERRDSESPAPPVGQLVSDAVRRTANELLETKFVPWKFHPRNSQFEPEPFSMQQDSVISHIEILEDSTAQSVAELRDFVYGNESYHIELSTSGKVTIEAFSPVGVLRAIQTFQQLWYAHSSGSGVYTPYAPFSISDEPLWAHRALNLDISRNHYAPDDIKRTIDAMASVKMNHLHVHATDSQAWPIDIPTLPSLAAKGAYHPSLIWTSSDLRSVQLYGLTRGVSVFIEIDMPGHTASIAHAFPELIAAFQEHDWEQLAQEPPSGQLKLNSTAVYDFLDALLADLLPRVSLFTKYFHTGGDEMNVNTYLLDETVGSNDTAVIGPLLQAMVDHIHKRAREVRLTPIVWEEAVLDWDLALSSTANGQSDVLVQAWRNSAAVKKILEKGYRTIFGPGDAWYLDCGYGDFFNPKPDSRKIKAPFLDWCSPYKNWRTMYVYNPLEGIPEDLHHLIEGGETHMWSESTDPVSMDQVIWPRAAAAAEVLWSGPRTADQIQDASYRLGEWRERAVVDRGIKAGVVQMTYCLMREGSCEL